MTGSWIEAVDTPGATLTFPQRRHLDVKVGPKGRVENRNKAAGCKPAIHGIGRDSQASQLNRVLSGRTFLWTNYPALRTGLLNEGAFGASEIVYIRQALGLNPPE